MLEDETINLIQLKYKIPANKLNLTKIKKKKKKPIQSFLFSKQLKNNKMLEDEKKTKKKGKKTRKLMSTL
jgi:hypothetical protein